MKKFLFAVILFFAAAGVVIASGGMYSDEYIKHLKDCTVYIEKYNAEIPANENSPVLHLKSTESIAGWQNGKCITKSVVFSEELKQDILSTKCAFSEKQLLSVVKKIETAQKGTEQDKQVLQEELAKYVQDNTICTVTNLLN